jgi:hypothetical protein
VDYATQPGSGTWDLTPGLTWASASDDWSWGATWLETLRLGDNSEGYAFGNRHELSLWGARRLGDALSGSLRIAGSAWGNIDGADPEFDPELTPTQDPGAQGGKRLDVLVGAGWQPGQGRHRLAIELGLPVWQDLDGPQLETDWTANIAWQVQF